MGDLIIFGGRYLNLSFEICRTVSFEQLCYILASINTININDFCHVTYIALGFFISVLRCSKKFKLTSYVQTPWLNTHV